MILDYLCFHLSLMHLLRIKCNLCKDKLTFQMERHKSQKDHRQMVSLYEVGAIHVVVILLWVVWRNYVIWRFGEITSTSYLGIKRHYQNISVYFYQWGKDMNFLNSLDIFPEILQMEETITKRIELSFKNE